MNNTDRAMHLGDTVIDIYKKDYPVAISKFTSFIQLLIFKIEQGHKEDINLLYFIEDIFNNNVALFLDFIKSLNVNKYEINEKNDLKEKLTEKLWYKWHFITRV